MTDDHALLDSRLGACLCGAGQSAYTAEVAVGADGQVHTLWLWQRGGPERASPGEPPAHEHAGPLPRWWHTRVLTAAPRCGRPRADGHPCRRHVYDGQPCWQHRNPTHAEAVDRLRRDLGATPLDGDDTEQP